MKVVDSKIKFYGIFLWRKLRRRIMNIINLSKDEIETIEERLDAYDEEHIKYPIKCSISIDRVFLRSGPHRHPER